jgi:hypothetical protein
MGFWQVHMETAVCDRLVLPTARLETPATETSAEVNVMVE